MSPYLRGGICYSGDGRHKGNAVGDGAPERNNPVEISSGALARRVNVRVTRSAARRICRVVEHALSSPADARRESFASVPEITLIPVKLTLCKISSPMLSPGFSLVPFTSNNNNKKKEKFLH